MLFEEVRDKNVFFKCLNKKEVKNTVKLLLHNLNYSYLEHNITLNYTNGYIFVAILANCKITTCNGYDFNSFSLKKDVMMASYFISLNTPSKKNFFYKWFK